ncbi:MAG: helix-hairpin-helix domain-containing protein [bacterium]|nr:helix-hairpin-helix domain-containing protein [bacterium]
MGLPPVTVPEGPEHPERPRRRRRAFGGPSVLGRRQALGLLLALLVLAGGRLVRQKLLVGPDGAWRNELWLDAVLEPDAAGGEATDSEAGPPGSAKSGSAMEPGAAPAPEAAAVALPEGDHPHRAPAPRRKDGPAAPLAINTCSVDSLQMLPGVGPVMAGRIDAARRQGVVFQKPADLLGIKGIGPATVSRLAPFLDFRKPARAPSGPLNPH